jgi:integrase
MGKLNQLKVKHAKTGNHEDGNGLRLVVAKSGTSNWILRLQSNGRRRELGLGSSSSVSLGQARAEAEILRAAIREGRDPIAERRKTKDVIPTFKETSMRVHAEHLPSWKNKKHGDQWLSTLQKYVFPKLGPLQVDTITSPMIREVLSDIWLEIPETARRVRQRIGTVLDFAHACGWRDQEAPMRSVTKGLPKQPKQQNHFPAMPWQDVPDFINNMSDILSADRMVLLALEFTILTASRSGQVRMATWDELDLNAKAWKIPKERMKTGVEHRIPLSSRAVEILKEIEVDNKSPLVFEGFRKDRPLSDMTLSMPLRRAAVGYTVHGFRSSFRDWCGEATNFPNFIAEACLAHSIRNKAEAAYARSDYFDKRRKVMADWTTFCSGKVPDSMVDFQRESTHELF